jgi:hypothetical protein
MAVAMSVAERLSHLLELADKGPALRAALAEELAELLNAWPEDCPAELRQTCETMLAETAREVDPDTRARLRVRLYANTALAARILPRETRRNVIELVRSGEDIITALADSAGLDKSKAAQILADPSGRALAVACKGAGLNRAAFSAIALLSVAGTDLAGAYAMLDEFDAVPVAEAARQLRGWRDTLPQAAE